MTVIILNTEMIVRCRSDNLKINDGSYKRVQPDGLISLSCNWVILLKEIDQMLVQIQINPTGKVLYNKNISKNYDCRER